MIKQSVEKILNCNSQNSNQMKEFGQNGEESWAYLINDTRDAHIFQSAPHSMNCQYISDDDNDIFNSYNFDGEICDYYNKENQGIQGHYREDISDFQLSFCGNAERDHIFQGIEQLNFDHLDFNQDNIKNNLNQKGKSFDNIQNLNQDDSFDFNLNFSSNLQKSYSTQLKNPHYHTDRIFNDTSKRNDEGRSLEKLKNQATHDKRHQNASNFLFKTGKLLQKIQLSKRINPALNKKKNLPFTAYLKQSNILAQILPSNTNDTYLKERTIVSSFKDSQSSVFIDQCINISSSENKQKLFKKMDKLMGVSSTKKKYQGLRSSQQNNMNKKVVTKLLRQDNDKENAAIQPVSQQKHSKGKIEQSEGDKKLPSSGIKMFKRSSMNRQNNVVNSTQRLISRKKLVKQMGGQEWKGTNLRQKEFKEGRIAQGENKKINKKQEMSIKPKQETGIKQEITREEECKKGQNAEKKSIQETQLLDLPIGGQKQSKEGQYVLQDKPAKCEHQQLKTAHQRQQQFMYMELSCKDLMHISHHMSPSMYQQFVQLNGIYNYSSKQLIKCDIILGGTVDASCVNVNANNSNSSSNSSSNSNNNYNNAISSAYSYSNSNNNSNHDDNFNDTSLLNSQQDAKHHHLLSMLKQSQTQCAQLLNKKSQKNNQLAALKHLLYHTQNTLNSQQLRGVRKDANANESSICDLIGKKKEEIKVNFNLLDQIN